MAFFTLARWKNSSVPHLLKIIVVWQVIIKNTPNKTCSPGAGLLLSPKHILLVLKLLQRIFTVTNACLPRTEQRRQSSKQLFVLGCTHLSKSFTPNATNLRAELWKSLQSQTSCEVLKRDKVGKAVVTTLVTNVRSRVWVWWERQKSVSLSALSSHHS